MPCIIVFTNWLAGISRFRTTLGWSAEKIENQAYNILACMIKIFDYIGILIRKVAIMVCTIYRRWPREGEDIFNSYTA